MMKLTILLIDSGIKKKASKGSRGLTKEISAMERTFSAFLSKNSHFKGVKEVSLTLTLCGKAKMKALNSAYRQKDKATDVLSFGVYEDLRPDHKCNEKNLPQMDLGDLIVCKEVARSQAKSFGLTYEQEVLHLCAHGFLHLLGFDHEISETEEKIMESYESKLVKSMYQKLKVK